MKITLMRDKDGATTWTLDINLQIEAMKKRKAQPVTINLLTSIRYASPTGRHGRKPRKLAKSNPGNNFPENGQWNTDDRIQRNHTNEINHGKTARRSEQKQEAAELSQTFPCLHGLRRAFRKIWIRFTRRTNHFLEAEEAEIFQAHVPKSVQPHRLQ